MTPFVVYASVSKPNLGGLEIESRSLGVEALHLNPTRPNVDKIGMQ